MKPRSERAERCSPRTAASAAREIETACTRAAVTAKCTRSSVRLSAQGQRVVRDYARGASLKAVAVALGLNIHLVEEYVRWAREVRGGGAAGRDEGRTVHTCRRGRA